MIQQDEWRDLPPDDWPWPNFSPRELAERSEGWEEGRSPLLTSPDLMNRLQALRDTLGFPLFVTSGYRSPRYNAAVSSTGLNGPHTTGFAVDISISGEDAFSLLKAALSMEFTGIGVQQKGPHGRRFIHLDCLPRSRALRPWVWSY